MYSGIALLYNFYWQKKQTTKHEIFHVWKRKRAIRERFILVRFKCLCASALWSPLVLLKFEFWLPFSNSKLIKAEDLDRVVLYCCLTSAVTVVILTSKLACLHALGLCIGSVCVLPCLGTDRWLDLLTLWLSLFPQCESQVRSEECISKWWMCCCSYAGKEGQRGRGASVLHHTGGAGLYDIHWPHAGAYKGWLQSVSASYRLSSLACPKKFCIQ